MIGFNKDGQKDKNNILTLYIIYILKEVIKYKVYLVAA